MLLPSSFPRSARRPLLVCLAIAVAIGAFVLATRGAAQAAPEPGRAIASEARTTLASSPESPARTKYPSEPLSLRTSDGGTVLAYPPQRSRASARATRVTRVVYLHGVHGKAENGCPWLRTGASELGWLVCPEANERLANGTFSWAGSVSDVRAVVARAEHAIVNEGAEPDAPGVLVGFSQGAYVALDLVRAEPGRWGGLVLLGAEIEPNAASLRSAGVSRVALLAGDLDGSSASMKRAAERLHREGIAATFKSLGRVGHTYVGEDRDALHDAIVWAGG